jgi:hypothetical protein
MLAGEKRISATTLAHAAKSGWRKPAVVSEPRLQKRNRDSPVTTTGRSLQRNAIASALPTHGGLTPAAPGFAFASRRTMFDSRRAASGSPTHGGLTPVAPGCAFASRRTMFDSRGTVCGSPNHGELTPAALGCAFASRRTMFDSRCTMFGSPTHGGLTPAAPANVRLCIANGALCSERTSCTRSGWRKPAVVSEPRLQKRNRDSLVTTTGRSLKRNAVASVLPNHGGLTPAAPGFAFASRWTMFDSRRAASAPRPTAG